jgi:PAS domain S-box-containing protein
MKRKSRNEMLDATLNEKARYKALFDRSLYSVYVHDFEGAFLDANDAALALLGYSREEMTSLNFASLLEPEDLSRAITETEQIITTGYQKKPTKYKLKRKDGNYVWVETEGSLIYHNGTPFAIQGIARDITDAIQIEEQRHHLTSIAHEILFRKTLEEILDAVARAIHDHCGFGRVLISLLDDAFQSTDVAFAGLSEEEKALANENRLTPHQRQSIFSEDFKVGHSYYIPHNRVPWGNKGVKSTLKPEQMKDWHPDDFLFIPLYGPSKKIVGLISVDDPVDGKVPTQETLAPVELFATQAAIAIENARLYEEIQQYAQQLETKVQERTRKREALIEIGYGLREIMSWKEGTKMILERIAHTFDIEDVEVYLINEGRQVLESISMTGKEKRVEISLSDKDYTAIQCLIQKKPINIKHASTDPSVTSQLSPILESFAWIPIMHQKDVLGALCVYNHASQREISDDDIDDLMLFANQAAHFVESTRFQISPVSEEPSSSEMKYTLRPGDCYLIESVHSDQAYDIFVDSVTHGLQGFSLSRIHPKKIKQQYGLEKTPLFWLSTTKTEYSVYPADIEKVNYYIYEFVKQSPNSIVLLDGIEYLVLHNGFDKVLKVLHTIRDYIILYNSRLIIPITPQIFTEKELQLLKKECKIFVKQL